MSRAGARGLRYKAQLNNSVQRRTSGLFVCNRIHKMDPLTTLLAAAAATGPNTRPLADPAPSALHLPTLQAIHRMQQQASPAPALVPTMPQLPTTQPTATMPKRADGVYPNQFSRTHPKAAGRFGAAGDARPASAAQQCTQCSTTRLADNGRETCAKPGIGPHSPPARTRHTTPSFIGATRSTTKGETDAPSVMSGSQQEPHEATASTPSPIQKPPPGPPITQPWNTQGPSPPTQDFQVQIPKPSQS